MPDSIPLAISCLCFQSERRILRGILVRQNTDVSCSTRGGIFNDMLIYVNVELNPLDLITEDCLFTCGM